MMGHGDTETRGRGAIGHAEPMILLRQPNRWSCAACAWAMVMGLTLEEIVAQLGHDGRANDGFDDTELTWLALGLGWASTWLEVEPLDGQPDPAQVARLHRLLPGRRGVLSVMHPEIPDGLHAVAWDGADVFDPLLGHRPLWEYQLWGFFWMVKI